MIRTSGRVDLRGVEPVLDVPERSGELAPAHPRLDLRGGGRFLEARGESIGTSLLEADFVEEASKLFKRAAEAGVANPSGRSLSASWCDFDGDGWPDLYVANDGRVNQLWINQGDGTFIDEALFAGVGLNQRGRPEASMGVDAADFDGDGDIDIFLTHLMGESNTLYVNDGSGRFEDVTRGVLNAIQEVEELSGRRPDDLHREFVDPITW
mgnify:CR=1 FL=1